jgi:hypothetical protein
MENEQRPPVGALTGLAAFSKSLADYQAGKGLEALQLIRLAQDGLAELASHAAALAGRQGASAGDIGKALDITRQAARARLMLAPELRDNVMPAPPAEKIADSVLSVPIRAGHSRAHDYPIEVFELADGELIVIVQDVWENTSLMNASERIMAAVRKDWGAKARVLEKWLPQSGVGTPGRDGKYAWSSGTGGNLPADLDDLAARGLDLRGEAQPDPRVK